MKVQCFTGGGMTLRLEIPENLLSFHGSWCSFNQVVEFFSLSIIHSLEEGSASSFASQTLPVIGLQSGNSSGNCCDPAGNEIYWEMSIL